MLTNARECLALSRASNASRRLSNNFQITCITRCCVCYDIFGEKAAITTLSCLTKNGRESLLRRSANHGRKARALHCGATKFTEQRERSSWMTPAWSASWSAALALQGQDGTLLIIVAYWSWSRDRGRGHREKAGAHSNGIKQFRSHTSTRRIRTRVASTQVVLNVNVQADEATATEILDFRSSGKDDADHTATSQLDRIQLG